MKNTPAALVLSALLLVPACAAPAAPSNAFLIVPGLRGIAFEFPAHPNASSRAVALTVHTPGQPVTATEQQVNELVQEAP